MKKSGLIVVSIGLELSNGDGICHIYSLEQGRFPKTYVEKATVFYSLLSK